jgi:hypothetical protein
VSLDLAKPDARHRRPLKFFLYHPSVKKHAVPKGKVSFKNYVVAGATKTPAGRKKKRVKVGHTIFVNNLTVLCFRL